MVKLTPLIFLLVLSACSQSNRIEPSEPTLEPVHTQTTDPKPNEQATARESTQPEKPMGESTLALLEKSQLQVEAGQPEQAAATLERALHIEPDNPWLWHRMAVLRMQQRQWEESVALANRSIGLAKGNKRLIGGNWLVISLALEGAGKKQAAIRAKQNSDAFLGEE